jgi:hypothetical protein
MTVWKLDFGEGAPAVGYQGVDSLTFFHLEREFGWTDRSEIQTRDRRANDRILGRFVAATSPATLRVILDPGRYILHVTMGDKDFSGHVLQVRLSETDEIFPNLTAEAGEYAVLRTVVDVSVSFLDLTFSSPVSNWVLNSVTLEPHPGGYDTGVKVIRRKFSDRFEGRVASERVAPKGYDTGHSPKRSRGEPAAWDGGNPAAASGCGDNKPGNQSESTRSVAIGRRSADAGGRRDVVTRMICVIRSWLRRGAE